VISCGLPTIHRRNECDQLWALAIQGRNECDQLWVTGDTGKGMRVISCGLPAIQGRNKCDQLWVTGDKLSFA